MRGLSVLNTEAKTTSDSGNTTNTGKHELPLEQYLNDMQNYIVFQREPNIRTTAGEDSEHYGDQFTSTSSDYTLR